MTLIRDAEADVSRRMRAVRRSGTEPELAVRAALRRLGISYRCNVSSLPGSPDVANKSKRFAIFVHGCFWHRHAGCPRATMPKSNREFWEKKFVRNVARDEAKVDALTALGYRVLIIWECEARQLDHLMHLIARRMQ